MKPYFNFNRKEKLGVLVLSGLILLLTVVLNVGYATHVPDPFDIDESTLDFTNLNEKWKSADTSAGYSNSQNNYQKPVLSNFDPNEIDLDTWMSFGFSEKQASSIVSYRKNYGPFKKKEDIKKLYVVSDEKYRELEPFIQIKSQTAPVEILETFDEPAEEEINIELNMATKEELISLRGIGDYYADRIIKYRTKLGGFVDFGQIEEMSISDDAKAILKETAEIDLTAIVKKNINTASKDELRAVPFVNWLTLAAIIKKRDSAVITDLDFLTEDEISAENKEKLKYYISY